MILNGGLLHSKLWKCSMGLNAIGYWCFDIIFFIPFEKYLKMCEIVLMYWKFNCSF